MNTNNTSCPLCVDMDGTLIKSDLLVESVFVLLKNNFLYVFLLPFWLFKGKAYFKKKVAALADIEISSLPYNEEIIEFLNNEKNNDRPLYLVTATNEKYAEQVAAFTGLFHGVIASNEENNLSGSKKLKAIQTFFKMQDFDYAGNDYIDIKVWSHARKAIVVSNNDKLISEAEKVAEIEHIFNRGENPRAHLQAMRPHQWVKNLLIFLPLLASHQITDMVLLLQATIAFIAFSLCASSVYLLNDILDLPLDRQHPRKRKRPYAAGTASIIQGAALVPVLLLSSFMLTIFLPIEFLIVLIVYYTSTLLYSIKIKNVMMLDVQLLAGLYTLRIIAGAAAVSVDPSFWMLAFSMFIFLSLAMVKRYSELHFVIKKGKENIPGRGYQISDLELLISLGGASGYMAVLVLALYINSETVSQLYSHAQVIWLLCPLLLYWVSRVWLVTRRGWMHDDPVVFAIRDKNSRFVLFTGFLILFVAL